MAEFNSITTEKMTCFVRIGGLVSPEDVVVCARVLRKIVQIDGKTVRTRLDTVAEVTLLSTADWSAMSRPKLQSRRLTLKSANNNRSTFGDATNATSSLMVIEDMAEIAYLAYVINAQGRRSDPEKIKAIQKMPAPKDASQLRSFLGLINFYGNLDSDLRNLSAPSDTYEKKCCLHVDTGVPVFLRQNQANPMLGSSVEPLRPKSPDHRCR
ncbi:hypothetical protein RB195_002955 [Necator americanus]|uniref:Reverse transcriptase/retrotransposon-derived protein RNase H-like domain-containing protein n=1 Tax=Necator americanus TaxID=51031 RepID=A0ABR1DLU8_NECAM